MAEYSKPYSKDTAFEGSYPTGEGNKVIKVGVNSYSYPDGTETDDSALRREDIEELIDEKIAAGVAGITGNLALISDVGIIAGAIKKKTRTLTIERGVITAISNESVWS